MADPVTLTALGTAAAGAGALGSLGLGIFGATQGGQATPPGPTAPPAPAPPIQQPQGTRNGAATLSSGGGQSAPSFIGASSLPAQQGYGQKSLLGQ